MTPVKRESEACACQARVVVTCLLPVVAFSCEFSKHAKFKTACWSTRTSRCGRLWRRSCIAYCTIDVAHEPHESDAKRKRCTCHKHGYDRKEGRQVRQQSETVEWSCSFGGCENTAVYTHTHTHTPLVICVTFNQSHSLSSESACGYFVRSSQHAEESQAVACCVCTKCQCISVCLCHVKQAFLCIAQPKATHLLTAFRITDDEILRFIVGTMNAR
jgi:hypothetical protein